ncbi:restriction endonuclease subunit S [uncultured Dokdonia sp.]|uniref:restriction endonuclease subunit S n=1 Tax=uncultured Dokdonia sp. TaxID=575653 RepID=UPI0030EEE2FF|tara:strand:+ start:39891 stop:41078 length:1188 start_codon:yes stop_codon:yes gene_type:complete
MELKELKTVCDLQNGYAFKSKDYVDLSNTVSLRMSNIRPGGTFDNSYNLRYLPDTFKDAYSNYIVEDGDLVIAMTDLANDPKILGVPTIVKTGANTWLLNQRAGKLIVKDESKADKNYLRYILNHPIHRNYYKMFAGGGLQINVGKKEILGVKIPLPPLETQKRIAQILDDAAALRDTTAQLLKEYDLLAQSIFLEMFGDPVVNPKGWEKKPFNFFAKFDTLMTSDFEKYADYPHIGIANIEKETGQLFNFNLVKDECLSSGKYIFNERHIIYSKIRPKLNKVALPNFEGLCSADSYPILINKDHTNKIFFTFLLRSKSFVDFILNHSTRTNIPKANKKQMLLYQGIYPDLKLQNQFADKIALIEQQKALAKQEFQESEDLFNCLLQKAFKGELV